MYYNLCSLKQPNVQNTRIYGCSIFFSFKLFALSIAFIPPFPLLYLCFPSDRTINLFYYQPSFIAFNIVPFVPLLHSSLFHCPPLCLLTLSWDSGRFNTERDKLTGLVAIEEEICGGRCRASCSRLGAEGTCSPHTDARRYGIESAYKIRLS